MSLANEASTGADRLNRDEVGLVGAPIPAGDAIEQCMLALWTEILQVEGLGVEDDFFRAGGDSLAAVALCAAIERDLQVVLPASILLSASTPRLLASEVVAAQAGASSGCLIQIRSGSAPAAIFVHGVPGDIVTVRTFLPFLDDGRRVQGLRARGLAGGETPLRSIEEMAAHYLEAVREVEPHGPYLLAGTCGGSLVAYEMAWQLASHGIAVSGVALVDPPNRPDYVPWLYGLPPRPLPAQAPNARRGGGANNHSDLRRRRVRTAFAAALAAYVPKPFRGPMLVVHSVYRGELLRDPAVGWPRYGGAGVEFAPVARKHQRMFDKGLPSLASALQAFFSRVAPVGRQKTELPAAE